MGGSFRELGPDRLAIDEGGGALSILGVPFLCAGIFMCLGAAGVVPIASAGRMSSFTWPLFAFTGLLFAVVGGAFVFGRARTTVDATRRAVEKEWGLVFWPMQRTVHAVDSGAVVWIGFESGDSESAARYPMVLRSAGAPAVTLGSFTDYAAARACAAAVATHLRVELEDATSDHARRMPASQADLSIRQRARLETARGESPAPPLTARSLITDEGNRLRIVIPNPRMHPVVLASMLLPLLLPVMMVRPLGRFFARTNTPGPFGWIFLGFLVVGFGILPAASALSMWLRSRFGATIVTASTEGLVLETRGVWRTTTRKAVAASDVVDLDFSTRESAVASARLAAEYRMRGKAQPMSAAPAVGPGVERLIGMLARLTKGRGVVVKTRQGLDIFGGGLEDDEIRYVYALVRRALVG